VADSDRVGARFASPFRQVWANHERMSGRVIGAARPEVEWVSSTKIKNWAQLMCRPSDVPAFRSSIASWGKDHGP